MTENEAATILEEPEIMTRRQRKEIDASKLELSEEVIQLNRVAKVVKGGRRFSFSALVVVGDRNGHVGVGFGKANEVPESIQKAVQDAKKNLLYVPLTGRTIPYRVLGRYAAARVMIRPASKGTGLIAGPAVRAVLELAGVHDVLTKNLGSSNVLNILKATMEGLRNILDAEETARLRGKSVEELVGVKRTGLLRESKEKASEPFLTSEEKQERRAQKQAAEQARAAEQLAEDEVAETGGTVLEAETPLAGDVPAAPPVEEQSQTPSEAPEKPEA